MIMRGGATGLCSENGFDSEGFQVMKQFLLTRILRPLLSLLSQGLTRQKLAWSLALGFACSVHPMVGATTLLCLVVGRVFRLNHLVMQMVNYFAYPIQVILIIPHLRIGEYLVHAKPLRMPLNEIMHFVTTDPRHAIAVLSISLLHATLGWLVMAIVFVPILYFAFYNILKRMPLQGSQMRK
jgi:uncharacterized protein (DUF2062 family)